jgi:hypothetical protein
MSSSGLVQGETLLLHDKRNIQVFYKLVTLSLLKNFTPKLLVDFLSNHFKQDTSYATFLAIVSTGLGRTNDITRLSKWLEYLSKSQQYGVLLYNYPGQEKTSVRDSKLSQAEQIVLDLEYLLKTVQVEGWLLARFMF